jgi:acetoin utilization deacetylase AcuC-like enzyme
MVVYSPQYHIDIGPHVFPTLKYTLVRDRLLETGVVQPSDIVEPETANWDDLALVHTTEYLTKLRSGGLSNADLALLELPWSEEMVEGFRLMVGGTVLTAKLACGLDDGLDHVGQRPVKPCAWSAHIGGGLHHAFPSHGEGFCPLNDVAVAARVLQAAGIERIAIVDLDVHHGNGTAFVFESDPRVFTLSMHQQHNYPLWKPRSSIDIGLPDGAGDDRFLRDLESALPKVMASRPECVFYLAGADPFSDDRLGGLRLTKEGLRHRDRMVIDAVRAAECPLVVTLAGGYARRLEDTVAIHVATIEEAVRAYNAFSAYER